MQAVSNVEKLFTMMNESAEIISKECNLTYIEAVAETGENLFQNEVLQDEMSEVTKKNLAKNMNRQTSLLFKRKRSAKPFSLLF